MRLTLFCFFLCTLEAEMGPKNEKIFPQREDFCVKQASPRSKHLPSVRRQTKFRFIVTLLTKNEQSPPGGGGLFPDLDSQGWKWL